MKSQEEISYSTISSKLDGLLRPKTQTSKPKQSKNLDFLDRLEGFPKKKQEVKPTDKKELPKYILAHNTPIFESPEQIAAKLNSAPKSIGAHVIDGLLTVEDVIEAIKNLKGNDRLDVSHLRNGEQLSRLSQRVDMNDMRWHGGGSGASSSTINALLVTDKFVSTSGQTSFTASSTPLFTFGFSVSGANQTPTTDYAVSGSVATLTPATWPNGTPADQPVVWTYLKA